MINSQTFYCANHPNRETTLRCNKCEKPICVKCAVLTPTGYRCKECVSGQQKVFETAISRDYILAFPIAAILSLIGSFIALSIGLFTILISPIAGAIIAESVRFVTGKRRSPKLFWITAIAVIAGCLPAALFVLISLVGTALYAGGRYMVYSLPDVIWILAYAGLTASTAYYRLRGINLRL